MTQDSRDVFITQYRAAYESKASLEQFAASINIKPSSVVRKIYRIRQETGLKLPILESREGEVDEGINWRQSVEDASYQLVDWSSESPERLVIISAQNATPVFKPFLRSLLKYCERMTARLVVLPYRYKNPTSIWKQEDKSEEWWDKSIEPYIVHDYVQVCPSLRLMGHIKIQPTASNPLSGFDTYTGSDSAIFAHPKVQLLTIPTPSRHLPKILSTTGSITKQNYTDSKAGHKGHFHHSFAAIVVEIDGNTFHQRHIHADERGRFYDLDKHFTPTGVTEGHRISGLVTGDTHAEFVDKWVEEATYTNPDSMVNVLNPWYLVYHDIEDFYRRNHHHKGNHLLSYGKHHYGRDNVEEGLQITADFIDRHSRPGMTNVVIKSNHDEALDRWLREADPKLDPENARFYHYMMYHLYASVKMTETGFTSDDPFEFWCKHPDQQRGLSNVDDTIFLHRDASYVIEGIEVGFHGDRGPNGSRGSAKAFTKIGPKTVIGHSHSPRIEEGVYQVGVSARLDLEYVSGPSSWMHTHCIIYPDGKRTLIHIINGNWRLKKGS